MKWLKRWCLLICVLTMTLNGSVVKISAEQETESDADQQQAYDVETEMNEQMASQMFMINLHKKLELEGVEMINGEGALKEDEASPYIRMGACIRVTELGVDFIAAVEENPDGATLMMEIYAYDKDGEIILSDCIWEEGVTELIGHAKCEWGDGHDISRVVYYAKVYGGETENTWRLIDLAS